MRDELIDAAMVLAPPGSSIYARYEQFCAVPATLALVHAMLGGAALGLALGGWQGLVLGIAASTTLFAPLVTQFCAAGNVRLRRELAEHLGAERSRGEFVGLCQTANNRCFPLRFETDDNAGFLSLSETHLEIFAESGTLRFRQADIRGVELVSVASCPALDWLRIELDLDGISASFLVMSREATHTAGQASSTHRLYSEVVSWHAERQLAWHEGQLGARDEVQARRAPRAPEICGGEIGPPSSRAE